MTSLAATDLASDRAKMTGTAQVEVTIVATVTVPTDAAGHWVKGDAVAQAIAALGQGSADYAAHEAPTGAPVDEAWALD